MILPKFDFNFFSFTNAKEEKYPDKTYRLTSTNVIGELDGMDAIKQALLKRLKTEKGIYPIYTEDYGLQKNDLFGMPLDYVKVVLPSRIKESLLKDDRVKDVVDFSFSKKSDSLSVFFTVQTLNGELEMEDIINV